MALDPNDGLMHTSTEARSAALQIFEILGVDPEGAGDQPSRVGTSVHILPACRIGEASISGDGFIDVGGLKVNAYRWPGEKADVYVRRYDDGSVAEIHLARHDGLFEEEMDADALAFPGGPKEFFRSLVVGYPDPDGHIVTNAEFEADWSSDIQESDVVIEAWAPPTDA